MSDVRECVVARSVEIDWSTNRWQLAPLPGQAIGAGLYLCVPVADEEAAAKAIASYFNAKHPMETTGGKA